MNGYMRDKLDRLISDSLIPDRLIAEEDLAEARGYLGGLLEGGAISPAEFTEFHHQVLAAQREVRRRMMEKVGIAA